VASLTITTRKTKSGPRYAVRYRLGGRAYPIVHGGSFKTLKEAKERKNLIAGELAAGRNPADGLRAMVEKTPVRTFREWATAYEASRVDVAAETTRGIKSHLTRLNPHFGDQDPASITTTDVQEWIGTNTDLKPSSLSRYIATLRLILDYASVEPNPARDKRVKLPAIVSEEPTPPTAAQVLAILKHLPRRWRLPLVTLEQTGMRVGEAQSLAWGDVDVDGCRFRLSKATTKTRKSRWVQVPEWLMAELDTNCPPDDRTPERRVFPGFTPDVAKNVMARACRAAKIPHFHPHDLRHRRLSLWHGQGIPARELADRAGHARASMSLDVYSHVMPLDEVAWDRPGVVSVWSEAPVAS
jgi:integrase